MKRIRFVTCLWLLFICNVLCAQDFSNKGKEFWLPYPAHIDGTSSRMALYISATENTTGEVQLDGKVIPFTVTANQATTVQISPVAYAIYNVQADGVGIAKGIKVISLKPVVVYAHILNAARSGSTLVFPTAVLGKEYISLNFTQSSSANARSQIAVVATEDNTLVEINLKAASSGVPSRAANSAYQINLNKGDVYQVQSLSDLTGSTIKSVSSGTTSCKAIAVFTGSSWTSFDCVGASGGDNLFQQVFPSKAWGRNYITSPFANRQSDVYRIIVRDPATVVYFNGTALNNSTLIANSYYQIKNSQANIITSDKPILVVQYMTSQSCDTRNVGTTISYPGDPEIITINPLEQTINNVSVVSARKDLTPPNTNISVHYLNVMMKTANTGSLKIDGAAPLAPWIVIPNSAYSYLQENVTASTLINPSHNIKADSGFIALAYGMGSVESYGYNAGTNIVDLEPPLSIQNQFPASNINYSATCTNLPFKINLTLTYQPTRIALDFNGATNLISGPASYSYDPSSPDSTYIADGKTRYVYRIAPTYSFSTSGTYPVKITTTSTLAQSDGCSNNDQQEITDNVVVLETPVADFKVVTDGCLNNAVNLTDQSTNGAGVPITRWLWEFSDGTSLTDQHPSKLFTVGGNYTAKLTSITDYGCFATATKPVNISAKPVAGFTVPSLTCENTNILFTDISTIAPGTSGNTISKWKWDLDNGSGQTEEVTSVPKTVNYAVWGTKNPYLLLESNTGCVSDTFRLGTPFRINPYPVIGFVIPEVCLADANAPFTDTSKIADGSEALFTYAWKLNDGVTPISPAPTPALSNAKNPLPKYNIFGDYTVTLAVTSNNGCVSKLSKPFTVNGSIPTPSFTVQLSDPLCSNDSIRIVNTSTVNFGAVTRLDIYWDALAAPTIKQPDEIPYASKAYANKYASFSSPAAKSYTVKLTAFSGQSSSCSGSVQKIVTINNSPATAFTDIRDICYDASPRQITQGSAVSALSISSAIYSGKGISSTGFLDPVLTGVGNDLIKYLVQNSAGCKDSAYQPVTVWPSPVAKWGVSAVLCEKNDLVFTDSSAANFSNIISRNWIFGDGTTQVNTTAALFLKKYAAAQTYTASLKVATDSGCVSMLNQQTIKVNPLPVVDYTLPSICLPDGRGTFVNQSSIADNSASLFGYTWNFGDPNDLSGSLLKDPTHKYIALGPYTTQLKVMSKDGCTDSLSKILTTVYPWPKAAFTANPAEVCIGSVVQFTESGDGITSNPVSWSWNLDEGMVSNLQNPNKQFNDSGMFTISYFFTNAQGCVSDTLSKKIIVYPYPKLILGPKINVLEGGSSAIKPKYVFGNNLSYLWTPPTYLNNNTDSIPVTSPLADITYRLNLTGDGGCAVSDTIQIKLLLSPLVPNAFSPNADGINDYWRIMYLESYPGAVVEVFNRYGQSVFSSTGYSVDWDGTYQSKALPIGTYYYIINPKNGRKIISGSVTIIR